jgi:hypothetical protein
LADLDEQNKLKQMTFTSIDAKRLWDKVKVLLQTLEELGEPFGNLMGTLETHSVQPF